MSCLWLLEVARDSPSIMQVSGRMTVRASKAESQQLPDDLTWRKPLSRQDGLQHLEMLMFPDSDSAFQYV